MSENDQYNPYNENDNEGFENADSNLNTNQSTEQTGFEDHGLGEGFTQPDDGQQQNLGQQQNYNQQENYYQQQNDNQRQNYNQQENLGQQRNDNQQQNFGQQQNYGQPQNYGRQQYYGQPQNYNQQLNYNQQVPYGYRPVPVDKSQKFIIFGILEMLFCGGIFGLIALILSAMGSNSYRNGNFEDYEQKHKISKILLIVGLVMGIIVYAFIAILLIAIFAEGDGFSSLDDHNYGYEYPIEDDGGMTRGDSLESDADFFRSTFEDEGYTVDDITDEYGTEGIYAPFLQAVSEEEDCACNFIGLADEDNADDDFDDLVDLYEGVDSDDDGVYEATDDDGFVYRILRAGDQIAIITIGDDERGALAPLDILGF